MHPTAAVATLPVAAIGPSASNPRKHIDDTYLAELAESIKSHGVIQPITVRPNPRGLDPLYELVVGECRWRAAKLAGLEEIPAFWRELDDRQVLEIQVVENLQRRDVHPIEEAEGYEQLMKRHGYKAEEIAAKIGKSKAYVYARLKLTALCRDAREAFYAGKLDASTALLVARIPGEGLQKKATRNITEADGGPMSYRSAVNHIRYGFTISLSRATFPLHDAALVPAAGACADCPKRSGNDPALFADLGDDADVCTDTACFEDKRAARHLQLIELAEQRKIPVLRDDEVRTIAPSGHLWSIDEDRYVVLDDEVDGDEQERTYREVLGEDAPVAAFLEVSSGANKRLVAVAERTAIEEALKQAGWQPTEDPEAPEPETADQRTEREALKAGRAAREAKRQATEAEKDWRARLAAALWPMLRMSCEQDIDFPRTLVRIAIMAWLRQEVTIAEFPEDLLARFGLTLPEEYDEAEELEKIAAAMAGWPIGHVLVFLLDALTQVEQGQLFNYGRRDHPATLLALAQAVGLDAEALRDPPAASVAPETAPDPAAPAAEKKPAGPAGRKRTEGKANPAPATPANEPAAPVEKPLNFVEDWPFPVGSRP